MSSKKPEIWPCSTINSTLLARDMCLLLGDCQLPRIVSAIKIVSLAGCPAGYREFINLGTGRFAPKHFMGSLGFCSRDGVEPLNPTIPLIFRVETPLEMNWAQLLCDTVAKDIPRCEIGGPKEAEARRLFDEFISTLVVSGT